tara:strand:- start:1268 stop:1840 length:573 start_codon:yes stop_codon:yes gene_type:complete
MHESLSPELRSYLLPLDFFYESKDIPKPCIEPVPAESLPDNERKLLFHDRDMTSTLVKHHSSDLYIEVLERVSNDNYLLRMVVLKTKDHNFPVEFGAIGMNLDQFGSEIRNEIEQGIKPLGGLLEEYSVPYNSGPRAFFKISSDSLISTLLEVLEGTTLYGRCNELTDPEGFTLADIVEILPVERNKIDN